MNSIQLEVNLCLVLMSKRMKYNLKFLLSSFHISCLFALSHRLYILRGRDGKKTKPRTICYRIIVYTTFFRYFFSISRTYRKNLRYLYTTSEHIIYSLKKKYQPFTYIIYMKLIVSIGFPYLISRTFAQKTQIDC